MNSGVEEPPGVQNFSLCCGSRMPPAMSSSSRRVIPSGASNWPGRRTWPDRLKIPKPGGLVGAHALEPVRAVQQDRRDRGDALDVVDDGRTRVEPGHGRERRLQAGLAATALERVEERGLLAADVGAGTGVHGDLEVEPGAEDVLAEVARRIRLLDRLEQPPVDVDDLAAQVDEGVVAADGERGDGHALDEEVRRGHHQRDVLAGARLGLVGVDDEVARAAVRRRQERPLQAGGEAGAATAAQTGVLGHVDELGLGHADGALERLVALVVLVGRHGPGLGVVPELGEDRGQLDAHAVPPFVAGAVGRVLLGFAWPGRRRGGRSAGPVPGRRRRRRRPGRPHRRSRPCSPGGGPAAPVGEPQADQGRARRRRRPRRPGRRRTRPGPARPP